MKHILFSQSKYAALLCMLLILPAWFSPAAAQARKAQPRRVDVSVAVVTPDGKPVPNAGFTVGEGVRHLRADEAGRIVFSVAPRDLVTVSAEGFTPVRALGSALAESSQVTLTPAILLAGENDDIPLPYTTLKKRYSVGSSIVIRGEELEKYSSTDIRNALTGLASGVEVAEKFGGPGVNPLEHIGQYGASTRVSVTTRGKQMMYMVDDIPVQIDETPLDPQQIESVTIVRDVLEKSLYGPSAANGIVYIKTKRGRYNDRYLTVDVEGGVNTVDRMPEYVSGADYARLNNIARNNSGLDMLYSRDDVAKFLPIYLEKGILKYDPFQIIDVNGVGQLVREAVFKGRSVKPQLKCGICGEHGGEPTSVEFCHYAGLNYVSCSPYRVPIARLAAAHAALKQQ